jgi:putative transposase
VPSRSDPSRRAGTPKGVPEGRHLPPPPTFPPWQTVYGYFRAFLAAGVWESLRHHLALMLRETEGREASPSAAIVDTQSVKTTEKGDPAAGTRRSG